VFGASKGGLCRRRRGLGLDKEIPDADHVKPVQPRRRPIHCRFAADISSASVSRVRLVAGDIGRCHDCARCRSARGAVNRERSSGHTPMNRRPAGARVWNRSAMRCDWPIRLASDRRLLGLLIPAKHSVVTFSPQPFASPIGLFEPQKLRPWPSRTICVCDAVGLGLLLYDCLDSTRYQAQPLLGELPRVDA
jgi:hypothetical protein